LAVGLCALGVGMLTDVLHLILGFGASWGSAMRGPVPAVANVVAAVSLIIRACVERERKLVWILVAAAISSYAVAFLLWGTWLEYKPHPPDPSVADVFWCAMYPLLAAAFVVAGRGYSPRRVPLKIWLDGLLAATAVAAIGTAFVIPPIVNSATANHSAVAMNVLYPMADLVIGAVMVALIGIRGWKLDRKWLLVIATFLLWFASDFADSVEVIGGAITGSSLVTLGYMGAFTCVTALPWQPESHPDGHEGNDRSTLVLPLLFTIAAPTVLVIDHFSRVPLAAFILTLVALSAGMVRLALALRDIMTLHDIQLTALTDELTQLPNRRNLYAELERRVTRNDREGTSMTVMMLDLDNFKQLNDTLGHDAGDELLRMIGPRLREALNANDIVARLGGDEFAILLDAPAAHLNETFVAEAVLKSLRAPFSVQDLTLRLTASLGIATYPQDASGPDALMKCADVAMYEAKRSRHGFEHYAAERDENTTERLVLAGEIAAAIDGDVDGTNNFGHGRIEAHYQPIADTVTRRLVGAEALARWYRADGTVLPPGEFIAAAELAGLARPLTRRMLKLALGQLREWNEAGHNLCVSVNATVSDLLDESFPDEVAAELEVRGIPAQALAIEVTESSIVADPGRVGGVLAHLHDLGVRIALDDFGTGYSSLAHLRDLPVDTVKIDRSFVSRMGEHAADAAIVYATIELAHRLGLDVVAEGVEDERTWAALQELTADRIQGYVYGRPVSAADFRVLLGRSARSAHLAESQSLPTPASTANGGSIS
jgi:diguanylate cyclase (GGDEF)-like protein